MKAVVILILSLRMKRLFDWPETSILSRDKGSTHSHDCQQANLSEIRTLSGHAVQVSDDSVFKSMEKKLTSGLVWPETRMHHHNKRHLGQASQQPVQSPV
jgi:hypothetical protein